MNTNHRAASRITPAPAYLFHAYFMSFLFVKWQEMIILLEYLYRVTLG